MPESKNKRILPLILGGILGGILAVVGFQMVAVASRTYAHLELFSEVLSKIQNAYVEERDADELIVNAINGMMKELDPHSEYMPPRDYTEMKIQTTGEFGGLGIEITMKDGVLTVVSPIEDTPAFRAGVLANDQITHVDGQSIKGLGLTEAVDKLRGKVGSVVKVTIARDGQKPFDLEITRDKIVVRSVKSEMMDDIAYIKITQFKARTTDELLEALEKLLPKKPIGIILDMRNNPGGLLDQAVGVADAFLKEGKVVYTEGRSREAEMGFQAHDDGVEPDLPLIVLVNGGSASASEIVAGALKDHKRGLIVGTRTFGKGSVQTILPLSNDGGLRITTALYFTPAGISIQAAGIEPDVQVEAFPGSSELMMREENIEGHFENRDESMKNKGLSKDEIEKRLQEQRDMLLKFREGKLEDAQLGRAKELLKSFAVFGPTLRKQVLRAQAEATADTAAQ